MSKGVNKVFLFGNLGQDPELRSTGSGTAVCNMRLATNQSYKDDNDEWQERTEWHTVVAFGRQAEVANEYLQKGSSVFVEGSLQTRQWEDKDGNTRYSTEVKVRDLVLGGKSDAPSAPRPAQKAAQKPAAKPVGEASQDAYSFGADDSSLPF